MTLKADKMNDLTDDLMKNIDNAFFAEFFRLSCYTDDFFKDIALRINKSPEHVRVVLEKREDV